MKNLLYILISIFLSTSCSQKIYLLDANKVDDVGEKNEVEADIFFVSYFAGDAIDYLIFEMDLKNNSNDSIELTFRDIELQVIEKNSNLTVVMIPLSSELVIHSLEDIHSEEQAKKRARDIGNALDIGLNLLFIGKGYGAVDAIFYSMDVAAIMMEDARAHKLLTGSIEEQKQYVKDWVLDYDTLKPGEEGSWDILFPRQLIEGPATFILHLGGKEYTQEYRLFIVKERVGR